MSARKHIVVAGGGLVGAVTALALQQRGFQISLIDRARPVPGPQGLGMDIRNVALSQGSRRLIESLVDWPEQAGEFKAMHVWEQWGVNSLHFDAADLGCDCLGWVSEVAPLLSLLWQKIEATPDIQTVFGEVESVSEQSDSVTLRLTDRSIEADLLVASDGARSGVRNYLRVPTQIRPTAQVALTTVVALEQSHQQAAWQRFLVDGPLAFLPSKHENYCSVVWSQSPQSLETNLAVSDEVFCQRIGRAMESRFGEVTAVAQRLNFPLQQQLASTAQPLPRVLLIGDALRVVHPLAGLGVNLGFEDVRGLLACVDTMGGDLLPAGFTKFARQRLLKSQVMLEIMSGLQMLYGQSDPLTSWVRNVGVGAVNKMDWLKQQIMTEALGGHEALDAAKDAKYMHERVQ
ncbi:MAG: FAD-dependent monooxygenase [Pseudomonadales bacterium]